MVRGRLTQGKTAFDKKIYDAMNKGHKCPPNTRKITQIIAVESYDSRSMRTNTSLDTTNTDMNAEDEEWIKHSMIEAERKRCISKILQMDCNKAVADGNNYVSDIYRLKVKLVNNGGEIEERSMIYKVIPAPSQFKVPKEFIDEYGIFVKEIRMYTDVFPEMEKIIRQKVLSYELFWPEMIGGAKQQYQGYLMEDLSEKGYQMLDRQKGLNFEQCKISLKTLGCFHGLNAILIERGLLRLKDFNKKCIHINDSIKCKELYTNCLTHLITLLEDKWKGEWLEYSEKIKKLKEIIHARLLKIVELDENRFQVLNHGDFWLNNILFRNNEDGSPSHVRFLDFQLVHYNSPCFDVHHIFNTSLRPEFFSKKQDLLAEYYESLHDTLQLFGYEGKIPTFEEISNDFDRTRLFGLAIGLTMRVFTTVPFGEELSKNYAELNKNDYILLRYLYDGEYFVTTMKNTLREANESGLLDIE